MTKDYMVEEHTFKGNDEYVTQTFDDGFVCKTFEEKDRNGNLIHRKIENSRDGVEREEWFEYNTKGQISNSFNKDGIKTWYDYDNAGNRVSSKTDGGWRNLYQYDKNKLIYEKNELLYAGESIIYEIWLSYDENGHLAYKKKQGKGKYADRNTSEYWYNTKNDIIHEKYKDEKNKISQTYHTYDYEYYPNGKLKKKTSYFCKIE